MALNSAGTTLTEAPCRRQQRTTSLKSSDLPIGSQVAHHVRLSVIAADHVDLDVPRRLVLADDQRPATPQIPAVDVPDEILHGQPYEGEPRAEAQGQNKVFSACQPEGGIQQAQNVQAADAPHRSEGRAQVAAALSGRAVGMHDSLPADREQKHEREERPYG
jgi:hypothetical protein